MEALLGIALIAWVLTRAVSDARIDHTYAKQGLVSPRLDAKYGSGAREKTARYGFGDFLRDAWSDHWQRRAAALEADREAYVANPGERVRLRDRWARARQVMSTAARRLVDPVPVKQSAEYVDEPQPEPAPALAVDTGDVPVGTVRHTDAGREQWDGRKWVPVADRDGAATEGRRVYDEVARLEMAATDAWQRDDWPAVVAALDEMRDRYPDQFKRAHMHLYDPDNPHDRPITEYHDLARKRAALMDLHSDDEVDPAATTTTAATTTGGTMTAPTGEAVNYETTISELEALAREQRGHLDSCQAAMKSINDAKSSINNMQESYRASAAASASMSEHLAAKNLDGVTLANAGTTADAMPAGAVDQMYDQLEAMETQAAARMGEAEAALGATEANLAHIQATYSTAHETVAGNLGGDASFLDSGGGSAGSPTGGGITESGTGDITFTGVMGGGGVKAPKVPSPGGGGYGIQHNGTGEVNVSGSAFGDNATVNSG